MPRITPKNPAPYLRLKDNTWRIRWNWNKKNYEFSTGYRLEEKQIAQLRCNELSLAFCGVEDFPAWSLDIPTIQKWIQPSESAGGSNNSSLIQNWSHALSGQTSSEMARTRLSHITILSESYELSTLTPTQAVNYINSIAMKKPAFYLKDYIQDLIGNSIVSKIEIQELLQNNPPPARIKAQSINIALKNRTCFKFIPDKGKKIIGKYQAIHREGLSPRSINEILTSVNIFYKWAITTGKLRQNPFDNIKRQRTEKNAEITHCSKRERDQILKAVTNTKSEASLWIAFYAGLRLGEIARLEWKDIDLEGRWIHIKKSKTGRPRRVPISAALLEYLTQTIKKSGRIRPDWKLADRKYHLISQRELSSTIKDLPVATREKCKWNVFRHTFASLLAQSGKVSIDQICAMMGNTPEVCRRHYAHMIPNAAENSGINAID